MVYLKDPQKFNVDSFSKQNSFDILLFGFEKGWWLFNKEPSLVFQAGIAARAPDIFS